uniref:Uncharacterized protein n=1 Tax=Oryza brachyantha TaxID=4533 RepID=J3L7N7_ORYBR
MSGGGGMLDSVVNRVAGKLWDLVVEEASLLRSFEEDVDDMMETMADLEAVLQDADDRARQGGRDGARVKWWLTKLKSVAYDVEDVLDELDAAQRIKNHQSKLKLFFSRNNQLLQKMTIAHNLKNLKEKIEKTDRKGKRLNLVRHELARGGANKETFAVIDDGVVLVGRDVEKEKVISLLLNTEAKEDISIIPIVGLGGLGKSTLAKAVYEDKRVVNFFTLNIWVQVKEFDLLTIGKDIIKGANSNIDLSNCNMRFVQDNLKKELADRRYLIVLDDLWEENGDKLESLKAMLKLGGKGSKIIATTRSERVVQTLCTGDLANQRKIYPVAEPDRVKLNGLSPDDCWKLMKRRAFGPDDEPGALEEIGLQIAEKCGGLPLVANALGQVMSEDTSTEAWEHIRDRKIVLDSVLHQRETLETLMLSYYYMKLEFKKCFTYLAAFPKGFVIDSDHLIQQWSALGYIQERNDGQSCIKYLLDMSFLEISKSSLIGVRPVHTRAPKQLTMHGLVHDLATIIAADEFLVMDATVPSTWKKDNMNYCRHAQLMNYQERSKVFKDLPSKVRTIHFRQCTEMQLPRKVFSRSKFIRILDLSGCSTEGQSTPSSTELPSSIRHLMLLAYLDISGLPIAKFPRFFHRLQNMQTLIMSNCSLKTLPANIGSLHKLCFLDLSGNNCLTRLPTSFENLLNLSFLQLSGCAKLKELPESIDNLRCLQQLDMSGCCAFQKLPDKFGSLSKLSFINLSCCSKLRKLPDCLNLESLEHLNLSNCHELENLPEDIGNLYKLEVLDMSDCYKIQVLPETFCQLKHLKDLNLSDCHGLKELPEYFGHLSEIRSLNLTSCSKLRKLPQSLCKLHKLKHLDLSYCIRLEDLPSTFGNLQLQVLDLTGCFGLQDLPDSISNMTSLNVFNVGTGSTYVFHKAQSISECLNLLAIEHDVHKMENVGFSSIVELERLRCHKLIVRHLENVESLEDASRAKLCDMLELLELQLYWGLGGTRNVDKDKSVLENLVPPRALQIFILDGYMPKDFPNWVSGISSYLPCLMHLRLRNLATCNYLPAFGQLPNLRHFTMNNIPNIRKIGKEFYGEEGNCKKLRVIWLERMDNLEEWWTTRSGEEDEEFLIPNLHYLHVVDCPKLSFLPHPPRSINWTLDGSDHVLPERGFGNLVSSTLPFSVTINNCNFSTDNWGRLQHLATLENFYVKGCSGLRTLPDIIKCFLNLRVLDLRSQEDLELLPEWLGQLASLDNIIIFDCPKLTSLPKSIQNLTALKELWLQGCKGLEILPEGLGLLISLKKLGIIHCPNLSLLPKSMKNLTTLIELRLVGCEGLEILPELFGHLTSLKRICVLGCPSLTDLPKSMMNLTGLEEIWLGGFNSLPEWIGQLSCLKEINIFDSPNMMHLPKSMQNLDALKQLYIWNCPRLIERCRQEDANKISHIPRVILDDKIFILGQAIEGPERESE